MFEFTMPPFKNYPLFLKIILMFSMFMFNMGIVSYLAMMPLTALFGIDDPEKIAQGVVATDSEAYAFLFIQGFSALGGFALTALMFSVLQTGLVLAPLGFKRSPSLKMVVLTIVSIIAAQFFIEWLVSLNQQIPLSGAWASLREYQKKAAELTENLLNHTSFVRFLASAVVIAVIPALAEELFFRGLLLGTMLRSKMNPYLAMAISGILFSVIHFQFDNVIAIGVLGAFLGFLYYVSGSLWLPIIAHFINNFMTVLFKYLHHTGAIGQDIVEMNTPWWLTVIGISVFASMVYWLHRIQQPTSYEEPVEELETEE
jgi:membrane protease YdiL (CAAX protease family)